MADGGRSKGDVAMRLVALREALGHNQASFARFIGISASQMNNYEAGIRLISLPVARKVRLKTGVTLDWIYDGERHGLAPKLLADLPDLSEKQA